MAADIAALESAYAAALATEKSTRAKLDGERRSIEGRIAELQQQVKALQAEQSRIGSRWCDAAGPRIKAGEALAAAKRSADTSVKAWEIFAHGAGPCDPTQNLGIFTGTEAQALAYCKGRGQWGGDASYSPAKML